MRQFLATSLDAHCRFDARGHHRRPSLVDVSHSVTTTIHCLGCTSCVICRLFYGCSICSRTKELLNTLANLKNVCFFFNWLEFLPVGGFAPEIPSLAPLLLYYTIKNMLWPGCGTSLYWLSSFFCFIIPIMFFFSSSICLNRLFRVHKVRQEIGFTFSLSPLICKFLAENFEPFFLNKVWRPKHSADMEMRTTLHKCFKTWIMYISIHNNCSVGILKKKIG